MKKDKAKKWMKFRHRVVRNILFAILGPYSCLKFGIKIEPFREQENRPYLILLNHQTSFDQFFVGLAFKGPVYYVASEDLFSNGFISKVIKYLVEPIPIKKQTTDVKAVMNCIRVAKEGGTIAIAPEGNRTYSGKTEYMNPSIAPLARKLKIPIALYRIEGGYGVQPRWSDVVRKGKMRGYVSRVITPEEIAALSEEELLSAIKEGLYVNEAVNDGEFHHKKRAEYLERAAYVCPFCGLSEFESNADVIECKKCGKKFRYLPTKQLEGVGFDSPFQFFDDWYEYQQDFINNLDVLQYVEKPIYCDAAAFFEVIPYNKKVRLAKQVSLSLFGDRIEVNTENENLVFSFDETAAVTVLGRNKLNIYHGGKIYQIKSGKRFNALKYVNIFHRYKNLKSGENDGKFLGL
ncbi:MAG: 1-acyl-sn-glycerol-3-phosphate acyltransferase [Clostridia bacterium]|nr:1-acyl-sn-glycerol-3-phosphate acyltransferase [Clostridia bacterium]